MRKQQLQQILVFIILSFQLLANCEETQVSSSPSMTGLEIKVCISNCEKQRTSIVYTLDKEEQDKLKSSEEKFLKCYNNENNKKCSSWKSILGGLPNDQQVSQNEAYQFYDCVDGCDYSDETNFWMKKYHSCTLLCFTDKNINSMPPTKQY